MRIRTLLIVVLPVLLVSVFGMVPAGANGGCETRGWGPRACPTPSTCEDWPGVGTPGYWKNHPEDWGGCMPRLQCSTRSPSPVGRSAKTPIRVSGSAARSTKRRSASGCTTR